MPLPRFAKLGEERRRAILDAALEEFAEHGFEQASFNAILERATISKGAIYYYFADKEDLYATVLERVAAEIGEDVPEIREVESPIAFWAEVSRLYTSIVGLVRRDARLVRLAQKGVADLDRLTRSERLAPIVHASWAYMDRLLETGTRAGAIREDLPRPLLIELVFAVGEVSDKHMMATGELASDEGCARAVERGVDLLRRILVPA